MMHYIEYGGQIVMPPPFKLLGCMMYGFFFDGEKSKLQSVLDNRLNFASEQTKRKYTVLTNDVLATFATTPKAVSLDPIGSQLGYTIEDELVLWIVALESIKVRNTWKPNRIVYYIPYIFVNNILTTVAGREIYGIPKTMGTFVIPKQPHEASYFEASTSGFKTFSPNSVFEECPLFVVQKDQTNKSIDTLKTWADGKEALSDFRDLVSSNNSITKDIGIRFCLNEISDLAAARLPSVMLKQFRNLTDGTSTCYQRLVEAPFQINAFYGGGLLSNNYELKLTQMASFPISESLGLSSGQKPRAAFWINMDFTLELGKEI
jgi:hypothetical protein